MKREIEIIGVPIDLGQNKRGVDMGPSAVRYAGLDAALAEVGFQVHDAGNIPAPVRDTVVHEEAQHFLPSIRQTCQAAYHAAQHSREAGRIPVFLGGDHSLAIGSIGGVTHEEPCGLLWIDAHGDYNTPESTITGNIHGMTLAVLMGEGYPELVTVGRSGAKLAAQDVVMVGIRDLDPRERDRLRESGITVYTMRDIDEHGMGTIARLAMERLSHRERLHVSLDMDVLDPQAGPGVGTRVPGGISCREAQLLMEIVADTGRCSSLDVVEINPIIDHHNQTARLAVELIASLFGKRII